MQTLYKHTYSNFIYKGVLSDMYETSSFMEGKVNVDYSPTQRFQIESWDSPGF